MMSTETWPQPAVRIWTLAQRFQKFLIVGGIGFAVNVGLLTLLREAGGIRLLIATPIAIALSMVVTFVLNEVWTWHDRGSGRVVVRALNYVPINSVGLVINWFAVLLLVRELDVHYFMADVVGAGIAAIWNFCLNNMITWRE